MVHYLHWGNVQCNPAAAQHNSGIVSMEDKTGHDWTSEQFRKCHSLWHHADPTLAPPTGSDWWICWNNTVGSPSGTSTLTIQPGPAHLSDRAERGRRGLTGRRQTGVAERQNSRHRLGYLEAQVALWHWMEKGAAPGWKQRQRETASWPPPPSSISDCHWTSQLLVRMTLTCFWK